MESARAGLENCTLQRNGYGVAVDNSAQVCGPIPPHVVENCTLQRNGLENCTQRNGYGVAVDNSAQFFRL